MQYRHEIGHALANFAPAEGRTRKKLKVYAQMQYRHEIGHALANLAFAAVLTSSFALLAFSKYRRARIALFHVYTASFASIIDFYSHSLRRLSVSFGGLGLPSFMSILHLSLQLINFYSPSLRRFSQVPTGSDCPYYRLHCIIRLCFSFSTILRFAEAQ